MRKIVILMIISMMVSVGLLSGCEQKVTNADQSKFVGTWRGYRVTTNNAGSHNSDNFTLILNSNGAFQYQFGNPPDIFEQGTYRVEGEKLIMTWDEDPESLGPDICGYSFTNNYKSLTINVPSVGGYSPSTEIYVRQNTEGQIVVQNMVPVASCSANRTSGTEPLSVSFTGSGIDNDGNIASYSWEFGDGFISTQQNPSHTFTKEGTYKVFLTVTDDKGATDRDTISITVKVLEPEILEDVSYSFLDTRVNVDGIIKNVANVPINNVVIKATLYDKAGNIIKTNEEWSDITESYMYDSPRPGYIKPGETAFFSISFQNIYYYDHYQLDILSFTTGYLEGCGEGLVISDVNQILKEYTLDYEVTGKLRNDGLNKQFPVSVWGAFYDSNGNLICVRVGISSTVELYSGQELEFEITVYEFETDTSKISNYDLKIDSFCYS